jgi:hypothetical protein
MLLSTVENGTVYPTDDPRRAELGSAAKNRDASTGARRNRWGRYRELAFSAVCKTVRQVVQLPLGSIPRPAFALVRCERQVDA